MNDSNNKLSKSENLGDKIVYTNWIEPEITLEEKIRNRENLFKLFLWSLISLCAIVLSIVFIYNMLIGNIKFDFTDLRFTDLLSLIMAIFAIFLAIAFYLKATETSNVFYNNTYEFTNHTSELLGRIEAGFEERLKQIDKGQSDLIGRVDKLPPYFTPVSTKDEIMEENKKLHKENEERQKMIADLINQTALQEHDKETIKRQLYEKDKSIEHMNKELGRLRQLERLEQIEQHHDPAVIEGMKEYLIGKIGNKISESMSIEEVRKTFEYQMRNLHPSFIRDMRKYGLLSSSGKLTRDGVKFIDQAFPRSIELPEN